MSCVIPGSHEASREELDAGEVERASAPATAVPKSVARRQAPVKNRGFQYECGANGERIGMASRTVPAELDKRL